MKRILAPLLLFMGCASFPGTSTNMLSLQELSSLGFYQIKLSIVTDAMKCDRTSALPCAVRAFTARHAALHPEVLLDGFLCCNRYMGRCEVKFR